jgi:hypothetical protein
LRVVDAQLVFERDSDGNVTAVTLHQMEQAEQELRDLGSRHGPSAQRHRVVKGQSTAPHEALR